MLNYIYIDVIDLYTNSNIIIFLDDIEIDDTITADIDNIQEESTPLNKATDTDDLEGWRVKRILWPAYLIGFWGWLMLCKKYGKRRDR